MYYIFAFRSRANAIKFSENLSLSGISALLISTPSRLKLGCGLSVKVKSDSLAAAKKVLRYSTYSSFAGIFEAR